MGALRHVRSRFSIDEPSPTPNGSSRYVDSILRRQRQEYGLAARRYLSCVRHGGWKQGFTGLGKVILQMIGGSRP
jgi:hypothetical protein